VTRAEPLVTAALVAEALRLNARYVDEVVIGWGLCPWAAQAWRAGAVARRVLVDPTAGVDPVLAFVDEIAARPAISIGLVIFPRLDLDETAFGTFAERVRRADRARRAPGAAAPFLVAAFHPAFRADRAATAEPSTLVPFIRRTPDPTLQLVRAEILNGLAHEGRDVSAEIARANQATVAARTPEALDAVLRDIRRDREAAYARI